MELWCPFAVKLPFTGPTGGSMSSAYPPRGVLHTTESRNFYPQTNAYYGHQNPPHFTVYKGKPYQHYPMNVAARALQNQSGGEQTNRAMAYQIEWVWNAKDINDIPDSYTKGLARLMRWIEERALPAYKSFLESKYKTKKTIDKHYDVADHFFKRALHVGFLDFEKIRPAFAVWEFPDWWPFPVR